MEHLQYLLIFSGGDYDGWSLTDEVIDQLSERKEMFGINDFELIKSPLADLIYKYMIFQSDTELCDSLTFDYTTLKIIYQDRDAFEINHGFDTFLKDCVYDLDYPAGGQFTYLVSIDGKLVFHHTSIVVGRNVIEDDDPTFHDDSVEADMVYRYFYNLPLIPADYAQIAKMLLTSETPEALEVL